MATTPATSVHSSTPKTNGLKAEADEVTPAEGVVTEEMIKEETELHKSSEQQTLEESSSQVNTHPIKLKLDEHGLHSSP
jgi:hypothetical protein